MQHPKPLQHALSRILFYLGALITSLQMKLAEILKDSNYNLSQFNQGQIDLLEQQTDQIS
ncbi:MAG: hypothetical protein Tsb0034_07530 [Ekhidna sp.]